MTKKQAFGIVLKRIRLKQQFTQENLAFEAGLTRVYIGELENGQKSATLETAFKLSKALKVKCSKLIELTEAELN